MHWAETQVGLKKLYNTLNKYYQKYGDERPWWKPSELLRKCVESKMSLTKYWKVNSGQSKL